MPVVYDGVNGDGQGDLFEGIKLWIAHRVPQRDRWVKLVEGNGGTVVRLEKQADMLIADNIKKGGVGPPPGSYSWKWIEFSVKNGYLEDQSDFLIGRPENAARAAGSSEQAKATRRPFTPQDDLILARWVTSCEKAQHSTKGNVIYQELEKKHPQHTWQSWRDRWVKKVSNIPRPNVRDAKVEHEAVIPVVAMNGSATVNSPEAVRRSPRRTQLIPAATSPRPPSSSPLRVAGTEPPIQAERGRARVFFTERDDRLLLAYIRKASAKNQSLNGNKIYQSFAQEHPNHSWHSWRDRWVRHLSLREAVDDAGPDDASNAPPDDPEDEEEAQVHPQAQKRVTKSNNARATSAALGSSSFAQKPNPKSDDERLKRQERKRRLARAARLLQRVWRGHAVRKQLNLEAAVVPLQAMMRGYLVRKRQAQRLVEAIQAGSTTLQAVTTHQNLLTEPKQHEYDLDNEADLDEVDKAAKEDFYQDFHDYCQMIHVEPKNKLRINGYVLEVWDLFRVATQQSSKIDERDWLQIADGLGLNSSDFPGAAQSLRDWYQQNLADFEEAIKEYDHGEGIDENDMDDAIPTSDAVTAPKQPVSDPKSPAYRSSPPVAGSKRTRQQSNLLPSDLSYPSDGSRKRRRLDKNSVIPATPEDRLETGRNYIRSDREMSSPLHSRPLGLKRVVIEISSGEESDGLLDDEIEDVEQTLPIQHRPPPRKFVEPETQDWHFGSEQEAVFLDPMGDDDDISPSQQLRLESDANIDHAQLGDGPTAATRRPVLPSSDAVNRNDSETRVLRSSPKRGAAVAAAETMSGAPVNIQAKKRKLPLSYRREPDLTIPAPARVSVSSQIPVSAAHQRQQVRPPVPLSWTRSTPAWLENSNPGRRRPADHYVQSHGRSIYSPVNALQVSKRTGITRQQDSELLWDGDVVDAQINHFEAMGYKRPHITQAMEVSTFQRGPMIVALDNLSKGRGIPDEEPGVWTKDDDDDLRLIIDHERRIEKGKDVPIPGALGTMKVKAWATRNRLEEKHGKEAVECRATFKQIKLDHLMS